MKCVCSATSKKVGQGIQEIYLREMIMKMQLHHVIDDILTGIYSQEKRKYDATYSRSAKAGTSTLVRSGTSIAWRVLDSRLVPRGRNTSQESRALITAWESLPWMAKLPSMMYAYSNGKASRYDDILVVKTGTIAAQVRSQQIDVHAHDMS